MPTPKFVTSELEKANVKFIKLVEKYPCIWNRHDPNYTQKQNMDQAWNEIAKEMCDTPKTCLLHWQKIRRAFSRTLRINSNGGRQKSDYYLAKVLEFVRPHLRQGCSLIEESIVKKEPVTNDSDTSNSSITYIEIKDEPDDSNDGGDTITSNDNAERILYEIMKMDDEEAEDINKKPDIKSKEVNLSCSKRKREDDSIIVEVIKTKGVTEEVNPSCSKHKREDDSIIVEVNKTKETKEEDKIVIHPNSCLIDANRKFFESLIPFIDDMNTQQNRRFRREIMCLIDDVLDDRDINVGNSSS